LGSREACEAGRRQASAAAVVEEAMMLASVRGVLGEWEQTRVVARKAWAR
jgi:hypothetical protein